ncbi:MAG: hypothetical protein O9264_16265 [Leptospira sp.]|nr:hypothetical protein [Leptospira sp.]
MKHPIIDCKIQIEEGIEAHIEQIEDDLMDLRVNLAIAMLSGIEKYKTEELAEWAVDLEILEEYLEKINSLESEI